MLKRLKARFDQWNNRHFDKVEHGLAGFGLTLAAGLTGGHAVSAYLAGFALVTLAETLKEWLLDASFDWEDWCWSVAGAATAAMAAIGL